MVIRGKQIGSVSREMETVFYEYKNGGRGGGNSKADKYMKENK